MSFRDGPAVRHPLRRFLDQLTVAVSRERYNVHERFRNGVLVTSIDETRGLSVGTMIVAGLMDGEFPSVYQPEVFLSEERQVLRRRRHEWQQRYLFYQAVTNFSDRLVLDLSRARRRGGDGPLFVPGSVPRRGGTGRVASDDATLSRGDAYRGRGAFVVDPAWRGRPGRPAPAAVAGEPRGSEAGRGDRAEPDRRSFAPGVRGASRAGAGRAVPRGAAGLFVGRLFRHAAWKRTPSARSGSLPSGSSASGRSMTTGTISRRSSTGTSCTRLCSSSSSRAVARARRSSRVAPTTTRRRR